MLCAAVLISMAAVGFALSTHNPLDVVASCAHVRIHRSRLQPPVPRPEKAVCESITDAETCSSKYHESEEFASSVLSLCGLVAGACQTVQQLQCSPDSVKKVLAVPKPSQDASRRLQIEEARAVPESSRDASRRLQTPTQRVDCARLDCIVEDIFEPTHASFVYAMCTTQQGEILFIAGDGLCSDEFTSGETATLELRAPETATVRTVDNRKSRAAAGVPVFEPSYVASGKALYELERVLNRFNDDAAAKVHSNIGERRSLVQVDQRLVPSTDEAGIGNATASVRRALAAAPRSDPHSMLVLRLKYNDGNEPKCSNDCADNAMWATSGGVGVPTNDWETTVIGSINGHLEDSSYGASYYPRDRLTLTVDMNIAMPGTDAGCPFSEAMDRAKSRCMAQYGVDPSRYVHVEYFLPGPFGTCRWSGLANVGCARPPRAPHRPGACFTLIKDAFPTTSVHELGHNLGFYHASTETNGYGDDSSPMGSRRQWKGYNAANRHSAGWLTDEHIERVTASKQIMLRSLHDTPQALGARSAAVFVCPECDPAYPNLEIWVSYRRGGGYDADLPPSMRDKVSIRWKKLNSNSLNLGTKIETFLSAGESFTVTETGHQIRACSIDSSEYPGRALIAITLPGTSSSLLTSLCDLKQPPSPPPMPPRPPPSPPRPPPPKPPPPPAVTEWCNNECIGAPQFGSDGYCDDGGPGFDYNGV